MTYNTDFLLDAAAAPTKSYAARSFHLECRVPFLKGPDGRQCWGPDSETRVVLTVVCAVVPGAAISLGIGSHCATVPRSQRGIAFLGSMSEMTAHILCRRKLPLCKHATGL